MARKANPEDHRKRRSLLVIKQSEAETGVGPERAPWVCRFCCGGQASGEPAV